MVNDSLDAMVLRKKLLQEGKLILWVKVKAHRHKEDVFLMPHEAYSVVHVREAPERGLANKAVRALIAHTLGVPSAHVRIKSGLTSSHKCLVITLPR